ncbi:kinase-like domain-containing protein [Coniochaeta sp. 2T2.1]|nr:kinase-like domain-containing protein [Coniochaeta sp. 2T2.1]
MATSYPTATSPNSTFVRNKYVTPETIRKQGQTFRLRREIEAMEYVRACCTSIPVPRVLETNLGKDDHEEGWILMERLPGDQLGEAWPTMTEGSRTEKLHQLKSYLGQLRNIRPDHGVGWIGSCSGGPAYDHRLSNTTTCGPFAAVSEFYDFLVHPVKDCPRPELAAEYRRQLPDESGIVFAHADVSWENILVDCTSGRVTGILDWEMAGFWPEWWEYRKAVYGARSKPWWMKIVKNIMQEYPREADVDMDLEMF